MGGGPSRGTPAPPRHRAARTGGITTAIYTADPAALVVGDTLYLYTGHDVAPTGGTDFVMRDWHVFTDDDGQVYLYWGSYYGLRAARLNADMTSINGPVITPSGVSNFWEAPCMFKRDGVYYLAYAANDAACSAPGYACVRYATASDPMGPWTHRGVVLDQVSSTTNHPAIIEFKGQWYMVYHNASSPGGGDFRRSVTIDRLSFNADGTMRKVVRTGGPLTPGNLAASATPSTSYVSPWETLGAINDGHTGVAGDTFNPITFSPVSTTRLRLNITSRTGYSTGVLEWRAFS
ncbi:glycosyl hydrolase family 43 [Nonomuraea fuscirosea]|uniref:Glycosyl hydrolase family 43 n=1 Tax=Nonomuraea fuscirosea TaxID=1291556 RepID=A0A2T0N9J3_9ACTN|nr:family 43 glycosylhydrolase [Nonomuraea fuscirosea]PRX69442.1 glycosyl hydrolase family 43 [Nonomuraea fuscirosea]